MKLSSLLGVRKSFSDSSLVLCYMCLKYEYDVQGVNCMT